MTTMKPVRRCKCGRIIRRNENEASCYKCRQRTRCTICLEDQPERERGGCCARCLVLCRELAAIHHEEARPDYRVERPGNPRIYSVRKLFA